MRLKQILKSFLISVIISSCHSSDYHYVIGVSQCSEDSWRHKLKQELEMATFFNPGVKLVFTSANDDSNLQQSQIDSLVKIGVDLLIVSPNQVDLLSEAVDRAYDSGIPVILYDRKTDSEKYTAYMGADNFQIGETLGHYIASSIGKKGYVLEIGGLFDSSPASERHEGFLQAMKHYPGIRLSGFDYGDWTEEGGYSAMQKILARYDGPVDAVFGGNDRMASGARKALEQAGRDCSSIVFAGVDALPTENGGMRLVADSILTVSAIYPTHGDELMLLALDILNGKKFEKEVSMQSSLVTSDNAAVLLLQNEEIVRQSEYLSTMHMQAGKMQDSMRLQQIIIGLVLLMAIFSSILLSFYIVAYRQKHSLNRMLQEKIETVERQRDELEDQRDKLIELSIVGLSDADASDASSDQNRDGEFIQKFSQSVEKNIDNPDLSVEDISSELCMSRAQLYRKVKAMTGKSPVEVIRHTRLAKADRMLAETSLNISEIAFRVGFSSASYFTKCYRDHFDRLPTDVQRP